MRIKSASGNTLILSGLLLIAVALFLTGINLFTAFHASQTAEYAAANLMQIIETDSIADDSTEASTDTIEPPDYVIAPQMAMPVSDIDGQDYIGLLDIPTLDLSLPVISEWSYPHLKIAPCRYSGSVYLDDIVICAHNYSSHFGNLKKLRIGDELTFTDMDGDTFSYEVTELTTLPSTAIEEMKTKTPGDDWDMTLFTCTIGGKSRLAVRCIRTL